MVTQEEVRAYSHKNGQHAGSTAAAWLVFYALAVLGGIVGNWAVWP